MGALMPSNGKSGWFARIPHRVAAMSNLSGCDLRVFIAIAVHADIDGLAWPSMATIAAMTDIGRGDIPRSIRRLERAGLIRREGRHGDAGANVYRILFVGNPASCGTSNGVGYGAARKDADSNAADSRIAAGVSADLLESVSNLADQTDKNRPENISARGRARTSEGVNEVFETFWRVYPSRKPHENPKKPARLKFEAAVKRGIDPGVIIRGAENFAVYAAAHIDSPKFIKTAEVWLNKECWNEHQRPPEPPQPRAGMI
jgi:Helix-turn-helix domain